MLDTGGGTSCPTSLQHPTAAQAERQPIHPGLMSKQCRNMMLMPQMLLSTGAAIGPLPQWLEFVDLIFVPTSCLSAASYPFAAPVAAGPSARAVRVHRHCLAAPGLALGLRAPTGLQPSGAFAFAEP